MRISPLYDPSRPLVLQAAAAQPKAIPAPAATSALAPPTSPAKAAPVSPPVSLPPPMTAALGAHLAGSTPLPPPAVPGAPPADAVPVSNTMPTRGKTANVHPAASTLFTAPPAAAPVVTDEAPDAHAPAAPPVLDHADDSRLPVACAAEQEILCKC